MTKVPTLKQSNGTEIPVLGLGTWQATDPEQVKTALRAAFDTGYRYIDTAIAYGNEVVIGEVVEEYIKAGKLKRSELFITTKLPGNLHQPDAAKQAIEDSLKNLRVDYIDLYLLHSAMAVKRNADGSWAFDADGKPIPDLVSTLDTWRVLEAAYKAGKLKSIGVSNFTVKQLQDLYDKAEIKPHNHQIEIHIYLQQKELVDLSKMLGLTVTSYSTMGSPGRFEAFKRFGERGASQPHADVLGHPLVKELSQKYNKTPAQILLRQMIQRGINVIPKSTNPERLKENFNVFDFVISDEDMKKFDALKENVRLGTWFMLDHHPWYPFEKTA
ncbi:oxidoreductasealdo/keto reductase family protein [Aphelenchoides avenae]|nr:oxidoreductasealdo/keto reductase family protein [Aphelenchus avenae]